LASFVRVNCGLDPIFPGVEHLACQEFSICNLVANQLPNSDVQQLYGEKRMQELALFRPRRTADQELLLKLEKTALRQGLCFAECGMLAFSGRRRSPRN
jgi:hypothetical protein